MFSSEEKHTEKKKREKHAPHALSTHFNNRPSSQIAVLTPLISTDICSLSSLAPSYFFNQINPNGHPLMASFLGKLKEET